MGAYLKKHAKKDSRGNEEFRKQYAEGTIMNATNEKELISAYTDEELPPAQRDFIEEHCSLR